MIKIEIDDDTIVQNDGVCVSLKRRRYSEKKKKFWWEVVGHYANWEQAFDALVNRCLVSDSTEFQAFIKELRDYREKIKAAIEKLPTVQEVADENV